MSDAQTKPVARPRIWGEWQPQFYGSGTTIVVLREYQRKPHLYIYADVGLDEDRTQRERYVMCEQLAAYMNGGAKPVWLDDFMRTGETAAYSLAGGKIFATGPMIDRDPPKLLWVQDDSDEAQNDRARLMDALFGVGQ